MKQRKSGSARRIVCLVLAAVMLLGLVSSALIIMVNAASSSEIKKELSGLRNQQAELKKEREALQAKIKENQSKTQTLVDKKSDIDQQISMTQASINNLNEQVQQYSLLIANKQAELEASQAEEQRLNEQYKTRIRSMEETGNISLLGDFVRREQLLGSAGQDRRDSGDRQGGPADAGKDEGRLRADRIRAHGA